LVAHCKDRPGSVNCASGDAGSLAHLSLLTFRHLTGTDILYVP